MSEPERERPCTRCGTTFQPCSPNETLCDGCYFPPLTSEEIALLDESVAGLDVDAECYESWKPPKGRVEQ